MMIADAPTSSRQLRFVRRFAPDTLLHAAPVAVCLLVGLPGPPESAAMTTATLLPSGEAIEVKGEGPGMPFKTTIPLHQAGDVRYFSAGVGLEERRAEYPPFPLKLIFVAGPRAYLSKVDVTIANENGTVRVQIPGDQVNGPWLFVDLPAGTYGIEATSRGVTQTAHGVRVTEDAVRTIYFRWLEGPTDLY